MDFPLGLLLTLLAPVLFAAPGDPGIAIDVDLEHYRLVAVDLRSGETGPEMSVATGSPTHATPSGEFWPQQAIRNPSWNPGPAARALGAVPLPPSSDGPLGVGKIHLGGGGIQIHGGAEALELGKPISLGCVSLEDPRWLELVDWLAEQQGLAPWQHREAGDVVSAFLRPVRVILRGDSTPAAQSE